MIWRAIAVSLFLISFSSLESYSPIALAQTNVRGLDFRTYVRISRGMSEGQLLALAGKPDALTEDSLNVTSAFDKKTTVERVKTYIYLPTTTDPFVTTITLTSGEITEIRRERK